MDTVQRDLELAWKRVKADYGERSFVTHPFLMHWLERDLQYWLRDLQSSIEAGWSPHSARACFRPKAKYMLRPGPVLTWQDELMYNYLVGACLPGIWSRISWSQGKTDMAYQLLDPAKRLAKCVRRGAAIWKQWRDESIARITTEVTHVVTTDITGFYENIDHPLLLSELAACDVDSKHQEYLRSALRRWSSPRGKGIPQGYTSSDVLAKLYLEPLDSALVNEGFVHLRYVDDIRIFCTSHVQARRAIQRLTEIVAHRGLNLQSAKTEILTAAAAAASIAGVQDTLTAVQQKLDQELDAGDYATPEDVFEALKSSETPPDVLEAAFAEHLAGERARFDATLFHFLIHRLGAAKSRVAVDYCLRKLGERPEETDAILRYLEAINPSALDLEYVANYMRSEEALYDYQVFEILRWFYHRALFQPIVVSLSRSWAFDKNRSEWLRSYAVAYLGKYGSQSDLDQLQSRYAGLVDEVERATFVSALDRLEKSRRNSFYADVRGDGQLVRAAIDVAKETQGNGARRPSSPPVEVDLAST